MQIVGPLGQTEPAPDYANLSTEQVIQRLKKLEQKMYRHARDLEFEEAARVRDDQQRPVTQERRERHLTGSVALASQAITAAMS